MDQDKFSDDGKFLRDRMIQISESVKQSPKPGTACEFSENKNQINAIPLELSTYTKAHQHNLLAEEPCSPIEDQNTSFYWMVVVYMVAQKVIVALFSDL